MGSHLSAPHPLGPLPVGTGEEFYPLSSQEINPQLSEDAAGATEGQGGGLGFRCRTPHLSPGPGSTAVNPDLFLKHFLL